MEVKESRSGIFVFGHPLSASSPLKEMLEKHSQLDILKESFQEAYTLGPERLEHHDHGDAHNSEARRNTNLDETYQKAFDRLHRSMTRAEKKSKRPVFTDNAYVIFRPDVVSANSDDGLPLTMKPTPVIMTSKTMPTNYRCPLRASMSPHSSDSPLFKATFPVFHPITEGLGIHTIESRSPNANPTVLPDAFLKSMTPICLIRHPAKTFPSLHRADELSVHSSQFPINASLRWCRILVEWYTAATATKPIVVDETDLLHEPSTIARLCRALSLDESQIHMSRDSAQRSRQRDDQIDIDEEAKIWEKEFGADAAERIKYLVLDAMDDYSYLNQCAIK